MKPLLSKGQPIRRNLAMAALLGAGLAAHGCTPDLGTAPPAPTAMELDLAATPPRAPQPTALVVNPVTGRIDFGLTGAPLPADCSAQQAMSEAQCEFNHWLETLDGFPTVSTASAPASGLLDPATLTAGENVVVVGVKQIGLVTDLAIGFDPMSRAMTAAPTRGWSLGELYWVGVRGYGANAVRDTAGRPVVGSPTMSLLKQQTSLTCGATSPTAVDPHCPAFEVVAQGRPTPEAATRLFQLEAIRQATVAGQAFEAMQAAGLPREEIAVLWGFPIHTGSVPVLAPSAGVVPRVVAADQMVVGVQGPVDPATVSAFVVREHNGPVVVMDLTAAGAGDLAAGFPRASAVYVPEPGAIVIKAAEPFPAGHLIGVFLTNAIRSPNGSPLVASPVSILLTRKGALVDSDGHSTVSGVADADAAALEMGRAALAPLLDNPLFAPLTGVTRENLVFAYAFVPMVQP